MAKYECVRVSKRPLKDSNGASFDVYRYSFKPIGGESPFFTSQPGGELAICHMSGALFQVGGVYELFGCTEVPA